MPKNRKGGKGRVEKLCGSIAINYTAATSANFPLQPSNSAWGTRAVSLSNAFNLFRYTKIDLQWCDPGTNNAMGALMGTTDVFPATVADVMQCEYSAGAGVGLTTNTKLSIPRSFLLKTPAQWYKTVSGTPEPDFEVQGNLFMVTSASANIVIFAYFEIEFSDWAPTGSTPLPKELLLKLENNPDALDAVSRLLNSFADKPSSGKKKVMSPDKTSQ